MVLEHPRQLALEWQEAMEKHLLLMAKSHKELSEKKTTE